MWSFCTTLRTLSSPEVSAATSEGGGALEVGVVDAIVESSLRGVAVVENRDAWICHFATLKSAPPEFAAKWRHSKQVDLEPLMTYEGRDKYREMAEYL